MSRGLGIIQKKILILLAGGITFGLSRSPRQQWRILKSSAREWRALDRHALRESIKCLYRSRLIEEKMEKEGLITYVLSESGRRRVLSFKLDELEIRRPSRWDGKWRIIIFDIPEPQKKIRDTFRFHLRRMGFHELQKSVLVHPYPCSDVVDFLIEFYGMRAHVRQITAEWLDNELHLKQQFKLK